MMRSQQTVSGGEKPKTLGETAWEFDQGSSPAAALGVKANATSSAVSWVYWLK